MYTLSNSAVESAISSVFTTWGGFKGENNSTTITHKEDFFVAVAYELARMSKYAVEEDMPVINYMSYRTADDAEESSNLRKQIQEVATDMNDRGLLKVRFSAPGAKVKGGVSFLDQEAEKKSRKVQATANEIIKNADKDTLRAMMAALRDALKDDAADSSK